MLCSKMTTTPIILLSILESDCWYRSFNSFSICFNCLIKDLNPIEYLWNEVDRCMRMSEKKPTNKKDL